MMSLTDLAEAHYDSTYLMSYNICTASAMLDTIYIAKLCD